MPGDRNVNQFFAIGYDEAVRVVEQLLAGNDVDSIGVNGRAILSDDGQLSGIWVSSVASGSRADAVGMEPGDIILSLESLPVGEDGKPCPPTARFCAATAPTTSWPWRCCAWIRTRCSRPAQRASGWEQSLSLADQTGGEEARSRIPAPMRDASRRRTYDEFVAVTDGQGILPSTPAEWATWPMASGPRRQQRGSRFDISPDLANFFDNWGIPEAILRYSGIAAPEMSVEELVDAYTLEESCTGERDTIELGISYYQIWDECAGTSTSGAIVALEPTEPGPLPSDRTVRRRAARLQCVGHHSSTRW